MAERITRQDCERMAATLNKELNRPIERFQSENSKKMNVGHLFIERSPSGSHFYRLVEIENETGGEKTPLGSDSHTTSELYHMLRAVREIITFGALKPFEKTA